MTTLLPRALSRRSHATTTEIRELADILVQMLEAEQRAEQGRDEFTEWLNRPIDHEYPVKRDAPECHCIREANGAWSHDLGCEWKLYMESQCGVNR